MAQLQFTYKTQTPGKDKKSNWLPTPKEGYFLIMRTSWPGDDLLQDKWQSPTPKKK